MADYSLEVSSRVFRVLSSSEVAYNVDFICWDWGDDEEIEWGDGDCLLYEKSFNRNWDEFSITVESSVNLDHRVFTEVKENTHPHTTGPTVGWTEHPEEKVAIYSTTFPFNENPIQDGIWPNHAFEPGFEDIQSNPLVKSLVTFDSKAYASSGVIWHLAKCNVVSGVVTGTQYSKGIVYSSSPNSGSKWLLYVRCGASTGYRAAVRATGSATLIQIASAYDTDLLGNAFNVSPITTGTEIELRAVGNELTFLVDGSVAATRTNDRFDSGVPMLGFETATINQDYNKLAFDWWEGGEYQKVDLTVSDSSHACKSDEVILIKESDIGVFDSQHSCKSDEVILTYIDSISVNDSQHGHTSDENLLFQFNELIVKGDRYRHTSDLITLYQQNLLTIEESKHNHKTEQVSYFIYYGLDIFDSAHNHTSDILTLSQTYYVDIKESTHGHTADVVSLTISLFVEDSHHSCKSDAVLFDQLHYLSVKESTHQFISDEVILSLLPVLIADDSSHRHTVNKISISQKHELSVNDSHHGLKSDLVSLGIESILDLFESTHAHTSDAITISQDHLLSIKESTHNVTSDSVSFIESGGIDVDDSQHVHTVDIVDLDQLHALSIEDSHHSLKSEAVDLLLESGVNIQDSTHKLYSDSVHYKQTSSLNVQSSRHRFVSSFARLVEVGTIDIRRSSAEHTSDEVLLEVWEEITPYDSIHGHTTENVIIRQIINCESSKHALVSDFVPMQEKVDIEVLGSKHSSSSGGISVWTSEPIVDNLYIVRLQNRRILNIPSDSSNDIFL